MLDRAISITAQAFEGKFDQGGHPYILHCLWVMNHLYTDDEELMCIGVMHDLFEDTPWTEAQLREEGFSERIVEGVVGVTHLPTESYDEYVERTAEKLDTRKVKKTDLRHNMDPTRMKGIRQKDLDRIVKYSKAYHRLSRVE